MTEEEKLVDEYYAALGKARKNLDDTDILYRVVQLSRQLPSCEEKFECTRDFSMGNFMLFEAAVRGHKQAIDDVWKCLQDVGPYEKKNVAIYFWALKREKASLPITKEEIEVYANDLESGERRLANSFFKEEDDDHPYSWLVDYPNFAC